MRENFQQQLNTLQSSVIEMASAYRALLTNTMDAFVHGNTAELKAISSQVSGIYTRERVVEKVALDLLLRQQPVARDLVLVSVALKTVTDWSRIGVQVCDIASVLARSGEDMNATEKNMLVEMAAALDPMLAMAQAVLDQMSAEDPRLLFTLDDRVDEFFTQIRDHAIDTELNPDKIRHVVLDVMVVAKYLERIGDHACNVAEWILFARSGFEAGSEKVSEGV